MPRPAVARSPDVAAVLRMQALAGNAATSRLLAREPKAPAQERTILIEGMGTFALLSFQLSGAKGVTVELADGPVGPRLSQASAQGTTIPSVTIAASGQTLTLTEVLVASFQTGGGHGSAPAISVELQGASREFR